MTQAYYRKTPQQALEAQNASAEGLSAQEARRRAEQYGPNKLSEGKKEHAPGLSGAVRISWYSYSLSQR
ncbi:MAG: cation-transporting P-type ATPase [Flavonifractor plautii]